MSPGEIHLVIKRAVKLAYGGFGASVEYSSFEMEVLDQVIALGEVFHYWVLTRNLDYPYLHLGFSLFKPLLLTSFNATTYL